MTKQLFEIVTCAKNVFCNGIYVPSKTHPCGWDFISFEDLDISNYKDYEIDITDISNGSYDEHEFFGMTLSHVLFMTKGKYAFERSQIDW